MKNIELKTIQNLIKGNDRRRSMVETSYWGIDIVVLPFGINPGLPKLELHHHQVKESQRVLSLPPVVLQDHQGAGR